MANTTRADAKVLDLLRLIGKPAYCDALARGTGRVLIGRPSKSALIRLYGEMDAWEHALRSEGDSGQSRETVHKLDVLTALLEAVIEATPEVEGTVREQVLAVLAEQGRARPGEIADQLGRGRPHISQILAQLKESGDVIVDDGAPQRDGRAAVYQLAQKPTGAPARRDRSTRRVEAAATKAAG